MPIVDPFPILDDSRKVAYTFKRRTLALVSLIAVQLNPNKTTAALFGGTKNQQKGRPLSTRYALSRSRSSLSRPLARPLERRTPLTWLTSSASARQAKNLWKNIWGVVIDPSESRLVGVGATDFYSVIDPKNPWLINEDGNPQLNINREGFEKQIKKALEERKKENIEKYNSIPEADRINQIYVALSHLRTDSYRIQAKDLSDYRDLEKFILDCGVPDSFGWLKHRNGSMTFYGCVVSYFPGGKLQSDFNRWVREYNAELKTAAENARVTGAVLDYQRILEKSQLDHALYIRLRIFSRTEHTMSHALREQQSKKTLTMAIMGYFNNWRTAQAFLKRDTSYSQCCNAVIYKQFLDIRPLLSCKLQAALVDEFETKEHLEILTTQLELCAIDTYHLDKRLKVLRIHEGSSLVFVEISMLWVQISEHIPEFIKELVKYADNEKVTISQRQMDINNLQKRIEAGFDKMFILFNWYCEYLVHEVGYDALSAVTYFDELVTQARKDFEAKMPSTQKIESRYTQYKRKSKPTKSATPIAATFIVQFFYDSENALKSRQEQFYARWKNDHKPSEILKPQNRLPELDKLIRAVKGDLWIKGKSLDKLLAYKLLAYEETFLP